MITFLLLATAYSWMRAGAMPVSAGPLTDPTIIHTIVFGVQARSGCSDMRSMYDILRSCFFTIGACVYRAVHPNIPDPEYGFWQRLKVTIKITFWAVMTPELIILWALKQWFGARDMAILVNVAIKKWNPNPGFKWTKIHGQFLQMHGFARKDDKTIIRSGLFLRLLDEGLIDIEDLRLTEKEINDKSKGDLLSKGLVVVQTTWFILECIARLQQKLPLLKIEVVTLAFATLNAITYGIWWYKPLNILCPIYIHIRSEPLPAPSPTSPTNTQASSLQGGAATSTHEEKSMAAAVWGVVVTAFVGVANVVVSPVVEEFRELGCFPAAIKWLFVLIWLPFYASWKFINGAYHALVEFFSGQGPFEEASFRDDGHLILVLSSCIGMIFGAVHFLSWDSSFPTHTELILWRASCVTLVVQPFFILLVALSRMHDESDHEHIWICRFAKFHDGRLVLLLVFVFGTVGYILARFCVLVLAMITLQNLPPGAFTTVSWTSYISHI